MLVIGAGPSGLALSLLLCRGGIPVTLVEAARASQRQFRGEGLMPSGLEALAQMGCWPLRDRIPHRSLRAWSFNVQGRELFTAAEPMGSPSPCTLVCQPSLLQSLLREASGCEGFRLCAGSAAVGLHRAAGRACGVRLADGRLLDGELVVGCDGRDSWLRQQAALPIENSSSPIDVLWFRLLGEGVSSLRHALDGRFLTVMGDGGSFALFEEASGEALRLGWAFSSGTVPATTVGDWLALWARDSPKEIRAPLLGVPAAAVQGPVRYPVRVGVAPRWHAPGVLLLGDAAHPMSPLRAQGINMALRDAVVAASLLIVSLQQGDRALIDATLPTIAARRLPEILRVQGLQAREASRADLLGRHRWMRELLARGAPWIGPLVARRWIAEQHVLRDGLPLGERSMPLEGQA